MKGYQEWLIDDAGNKRTNVNIEVRVANSTPGAGAKATIFSNAAGAAKANPFTNLADGSYSFFANDGRYDVVLNPGTVDQKIIPAVEVVDGLDLSQRAVRVASGESAVVVPPLAERTGDEDTVWAFDKDTGAAKALPVGSFPPGPQGPPGTNNTVATLEALAALDTALVSAIAAGATFIWKTGNYSSLVDGVDYVQSNSVPATTGAWVRIGQEDLRKLGAFSGSTIPDNQTPKQAMQALETAVEARVTTAAISATDGTGANIPRYKAPSSFAYLRGVGDKLDDNRGALDFLPFNRHADVKEATSTWDATDALNDAMSDIGGGQIDCTAVGRIALGEPLLPPRGTSLFSTRAVDPQQSKGTQFFLLPGANCPLYKTPAAAGGSAHNFLTLSGLVFNGNAANQSANTPLGLVQFLDEYIGTRLENCIFFNSYGPNLSISGDVYAKNIWCVEAYLPGTTEADYALRINPGLSGSNRLGLINLDNIFVELPRTALGQDPKADEAYRAKSIHMNRAAAVVATRIHCEAAIYGLSIESCQSVTIAQVTGAWIGKTTVADSALVSIIDANTDFIKIGGGQTFGGETPTPASIHAVRKRSGLSSQRFPDLATQSGGPSYTKYEANVPSQSACPVTAESITANAINVVAVGDAGAAEVRVVHVADGDQSDLAQWSGIRVPIGDEKVEFGTTKNQSGSVWKAFLQILSTGNAFDSIKMLGSLILARVANTSGFNNGAMAMVGSTDSNARPQIRVNGYDYWLPVWRNGSGSPVNVVTPAHPVTFYYDFTNQKHWASIGDTSADWQALN